jgi:GrpB-like predicted nucleotidyltransferase (UPF0157 family)
LAQVGNVNQFVGFVDALRAQPAERERLGRAAQNFYRERFDVQHVITALRAAAWKPVGEGIRLA